MLLRVLSHYLTHVEKLKINRFTGSGWFPPDYFMFQQLVRVGAVHDAANGRLISDQQGSTRGMFAIAKFAKHASKA
jgi:hypothetical protein